MAGNSGEPGRTVISKFVAILMAFTDGREFTLSELALQTDLAVSTAHRLLTDLVRMSLLERPDGVAYRPGPGLRGLFIQAKPATLHGRAPFVVEDLAVSLHTTARMGVLDGLEIAYIEKKMGPKPGTLFPNRARLPLHATALGKVLLAFGARQLTRVVSGDLMRYTPKTLVCPIELERVLNQTRLRGYALAEGELHPTVSAVAVPVFDAKGRTIAAIEVELVNPGPAAVDIGLRALLTAARCLRRELAFSAQRGRPTADAPYPAEPPSLVRTGA
jgi:DNA-binding IclR family transcriptional regulator